MKNKGRKNFEQSLWESWATTNADCLCLVLLPVLFLPTKQLEVNSRAKEGSILTQKVPIIMRRDVTAFLVH